MPRRKELIKYKSGAMSSSNAHTTCGGKDVETKETKIKKKKKKKRNLGERLSDRRGQDKQSKDSGGMIFKYSAGMATRTVQKIADPGLPRHAFQLVPLQRYSKRRITNESDRGGIPPRPNCGRCEEFRNRAAPSPQDAFWISICIKLRTANVRGCLFAIILEYKHKIARVL